MSSVPFAVMRSVSVCCSLGRRASRREDSQRGRGPVTHRRGDGGAAVLSSRPARPLHHLDAGRPRSATPLTLISHLPPTPSAPPLSPSSPCLCHPPLSPSLCLTALSLTPPLSPSTPLSPSSLALLALTPLCPPPLSPYSVTLLSDPPRCVSVTLLSVALHLCRP